MFVDGVLIKRAALSWMVSSFLSVVGAAPIQVQIDSGRTPAAMKLQIVALSISLLALVIVSETVSQQQESDHQPPPESDATLIFLEKLAENGKRLADQAIGTVLELLNDSNKEKLKHIAKDIWSKAEKVLKEVLQE